MPDSHMVIGLLAETPLHPGSGQSNDVVDLPVSRNAVTGHPEITDSAMKGALSQWAEEQAHLGSDARKVLFGKEGHNDGGYLNISAAQLLFLPVRRLNGPYAWITCPLCIEPLQRTSERSGLNFIENTTLPSPANLQTFSNWGATKVFLEEYIYDVDPQSGPPLWLRNVLSHLAPVDLQERLLGQAALMNDSEFDWYAQHGLPVQPRNKLDENKLSENLWYEETIARDTLFFVHLGLRAQHRDAVKAFDELKKGLAEKKYMVVGGDESLGRGWVRMTVYAKP